MNWFKTKFLKSVFSCSLSFFAAIQPVLGRINSEDSIEFQDTDGKIIFSSSLGGSGKFPNRARTSGSFGTVMRYDFNNDGTWDEIVAKSGRRQIRQFSPKAGLFSAVTVSEYSKDYVNELEYRISEDLSRYDLWQIRVRPYAVYFAEEDANAPDDNCSLKLKDGSVRGLAKTSEELRGLLNKKENLCPPEAQKNIETARSELSEGNTSAYLACMNIIGGQASKDGNKLEAAFAALAIGSKKQTIFCTDNLDATNKTAQLEERSGAITFSNKFVGSANHDQIKFLFLHEYLHKELKKVESEIKKFDACCSKGYDSKNPICKELSNENREHMALDYQRTDRFGLIRPESFDPDIRQSSKTANAAQASAVGKSPKHQAGESVATTVQPLPKSREEIKSVALGEKGLARKLSESFAPPEKAVQAVQRLAREAGIPKAQAASETPQPTTPVVRPAVASNTRAASGGRAPAAASASSEPPLSRSVTPSSEVTKVAGLSKSGAPVLKTSKGETLGSFSVSIPNTRLGGAAAPTSWTSLTLTKPGASAPSSAPAAVPVSSASSGSGTAIAGRGTEAPPEASASGGRTPAGSRGAVSSGSSAAAAARTVTAPKVPDRAPEEVSVKSRECAVSGQLRTGTHATLCLKQTEVNGRQDLRNMIRGARNPGQLIRERWFGDHLNRAHVRVHDGTESFGSNDRPEHWYLDRLRNGRSP